MTARGRHYDEQLATCRRHSTPVGESCCAQRLRARDGGWLRRRRGGLTLVELLITVTIMAIIAAAILGTAAAALDSARASRTESIILRLHTLLMERWDTYQTRRVDINPKILSDLEDNLRVSVSDPATRNLYRGQILADLRLLGIRELMKLEMPDRWTDVTLAGLPEGDGNLNPKTLSTGAPQILSTAPALSNVYLRHFRTLQTDKSEVATGFQGAECLYMVIMQATGDGEARTMFSEQDIGDVDGDGAPEFLDGWGRPISWVRWPAGFVSDVQPLIFDPIANEDVRAPDQDPDPFDLYRRDSREARKVTAKMLSSLYPSSVKLTIQQMESRIASFGGAYRIVPLIYSAGPDSISDLYTDPGPGFLAGVDPYVILDPNDNLQIASPDDGNGDGDDNSLDNIHNHLIEF